jgi:hypothetical protein
MTGYRRPRSLLPTYAPVPPRKIARITNPRVPPTVSAIRHATRINPTNITASEILITSHTIPHPQPKPLAPIPGVKSGTDLIAYTEIHQHCHQPNGLTFEERMRIAQYPVKGGGFEIYRIPRPGTSELQLFLPLAVPTSRLGVPRLVLDTLYKSRPRHPCQASHAASSTETGSHAYARPMICSAVWGPIPKCALGPIIRGSPCRADDHAPDDAPHPAGCGGSSGARSSGRAGVTRVFGRRAPFGPTLGAHLSRAFDQS